jgi:hypothetical protein
LADHLARFVDETTPVAREHSAGGFSMQVAPGVDTVPERHLPIVADSAGRAGSSARDRIGTIF